MQAREERLVTGYTGRVLLAMSGGYLAIQFGRNVLPPLLPSIVDSLDITPFLAGVALTLLSATYALAQYPGGRLSDRLSRKTVLVAAAAIAAAGFVLLASATAYPPFLLGAATVGVGAGLYWISLRALLADLFVERRGVAFGLQDALGFAGPLAASGGAVAVLALAAWPAAFPPVVALLAIVLLFAHAWIREPYVVERVAFDVRSTGGRVFADRRIRRLVVAYSCVVFSMQAVMGFLPTFLQAERGFSPTLASVAFGLLFVGAVVTLPVAGTLGDRFAHVPVAIGGIALAAVGLGVVLAAPSTAATAAGGLVFALGAWAFPPVVQSYLMSLFPDATMGGDFGAFKTVYAGVGSLGPAYVGLVGGLASYATAFAGLVVCLLIAVLIVARTA